MEAGKEACPRQLAVEEDSDPFTSDTFCDPTMWFDQDCAPARHLSYLLPVSCNSPPPKISLPGSVIWSTQRPGVSQVWPRQEPDPS